MKVFKIEAGKLAKWLLITFAASTLICALALWAGGLPRAIRNGEDWPKTHLGDGNS